MFISQLPAALNHLEVNDLTDPEEEQRLCAPIESDDEDAGLVQALLERTEVDVEGADDGVEVVPMTLKEARLACEAVKTVTFVQENQEIPALTRFLDPCEALVQELEA